MVKYSLNENILLFEIDPDNTTALSNRGLTYQKMGRYEESLADLNRSLVINPNNILALINHLQI